MKQRRVESFLSPTTSAERARNMEQWKSVDQNVVGAKIVHEGRAAGDKCLIAAGVKRQLRCTGRASGMKIGGYCVGPPAPSKSSRSPFSLAIRSSKQPSEFSVTPSASACRMYVKQPAFLYAGTAAFQISISTEA